MKVFTGFLIILSMALAILALVMSITSDLNYQSNKGVCQTTKQQPAFVAAVDPNTGELFAIKTLQKVCTDVKTK